MDTCVLQTSTVKDSHSLSAVCYEIESDDSGVL